MYIATPTCLPVLIMARIMVVDYGAEWNDNGIDDDDREWVFVSDALPLMQLRERHGNAITDV